jgi:hypothetical protein
MTSLTIYRGMDRAALEVAARQPVRLSLRELITQA